MSSITIWDRNVFYTNQIGKCFWCSDPCCRVDVCFEAWLCRGCEASVGRDLDRLNRDQFGEDYAENELIEEGNHAG